MLGTALLIVGASAMNQLIELRRDALMTRTASRPLPSNRMSVRQAGVFAAVTSLSGMVCLAALTPLSVALLAGLSWVIYVLVYTPLKLSSPWHTPVGAVAVRCPC